MYSPTARSVVLKRRNSAALECFHSYCCQIEANGGTVQRASGTSAYFLPQNVILNEDLYKITEEFDRYLFSCK